jgi:hypothetical protein
VLLRSIAAHVKARRDFWSLAYGIRIQREVVASFGPALGASTCTILATAHRALQQEARHG